jgi:hypothetical protein
MTFKTPDEVAAAAPTWQELAEQDPATATLRARVKTAMADTIKHPDGHAAPERKDDGRLYTAVYDVLKFSVSLTRIPEDSVRLIRAELALIGWHCNWSWSTLSCYAYVNKRYIPDDDDDA